MIRHFTGTFADEAEVSDLNEVDIKGGCLGWLQCGSQFLQEERLVRFFYRKTTFLE
jgi:hypothetical protein